MTDRPSKIERVLNLLACLLDTNRPLTQDEIVREVAGYPEQKSAYRRAFERDKELLRGMGIPITVEALTGGDEHGYRVRPDDYYLPDLGLTAEETAALRVAVAAVSLGDTAGEGALMKLGAAGLGEAVPPIASLPLVPSLAGLFEGFRERAVVAFPYRGERRELEPWALASRRGHWYVVGLDRGRGALRSFRADRIGGEVEVGPPGGFERPGDFDPDAHLRSEPWLFGDAEPVTVRLLVDADRRELALARVGEESVVETRPDGAVVLEVPVVDRAAFRSFVLELLEHAEVLGPPEVRGEVVAWLEAVVAS